MTVQNYTNSINVNSSNKEAFSALTENLHYWWGKTSSKLFEENGQFTVTFDNGYWWTFKIVEFKPNNKLIWKCVNGEPEFNKEWINHTIHWKISSKNNSTHINFLQIGLTPELDCYEVCSSTWDRFLLGELKNYLN